MASDLEEDIVAGLQLGELGAIISQRGYGHVIHFRDDVATSEINVFGKACRIDFGDYNAGDLAHVELPRELGSKFLHVQAELGDIFTGGTSNTSPWNSK